MKKLFLGMLLIGVAAALPAWFGFRAESALREALADADVAPYAHVALSDYQRGWLHSRGTVAVSLKDDYVDALLASAGPEAAEVRRALRDGSLEFDLEVAHGPLVPGPPRFIGAARAHMSLAVPDQLADWVQGAGYLMQFTARTGFDGATEVVAKVPALEHRTPDGVRIALSGIDLEGQYEGGQQRLLGTLEMASLEVTDGDSRFVLDRLHVASDSTRISPAVHLTEATAGIGGISVSSRNPLVGVLELEDLALVTRVAPGGTEGRLDLSAEYRLGSLLTPQMTVTNGRFGLAIRNVGIASLEAYDAWSQAMTLRGGPDDALMGELVQLAGTFLRDGPIIELEPVSATYNGQPVDARLRLSVNAAAVPSADRLMQLDPLALMGAIAMDGEVAAASALVRQIASARLMEGARAELTSQGREPSDTELAALVEPQVDAILAGLVQQGLLRREGDRYRSELALRNGQAEINGQAMPLPL